MIILSILFLVTAILYSSVGFGGGSTYLALLLIWQVPFTIFPLIALSCNIIVVLGNCINYIRAGNLNLKLLTPYIIGSIPLAYIGGSLPVEKKIFEILLLIVLSLSGTLLLFNFKSYNDSFLKYKKISTPVSVFIGSILGFISGIVGIGGGIFLSPILFLLKAGKPKHIITAASLFILINSIFGIIGQLSKKTIFSEISNYWYLLIIVLIGGLIGNFLNLKIFPTRVLALVTGLLVLLVSVRMAIRLIYWLFKLQPFTSGWIFITILINMASYTYMLPKNKTLKKKKTDIIFLLKEAELEKKKEKRNKILYFLLFFSALGFSSLIISL